MKSNPVAIMQNGKIVTVPEDRLHKGDLVLLQVGDIVPADLKLIEANNLEVDEFELTGELLPVAKKAGEQSEVRIYKGSKAVKGSCQGIVVAIGEDTEYEKVLQQVWTSRNRERKIKLFKVRYFFLLLALVPAIISSLLRFDSQSRYFLIYPIIATILILLQNSELFHYAVIRQELRRLVKRDIIIKEFYSLEHLHEISMVCFDKTGVLTSREIKVKNVYVENEMVDIEKEKKEGPLLKLIRVGCALCNDVVIDEKIDQANPIDKALIAHALRNGGDLKSLRLKYKKIGEKPFNSDDRYMSCTFQIDGQNVHFAKGDPETIVKMCGSYFTRSGNYKSIDFEFVSSVRRKIDLLSKNGDILLALAYKIEQNPLDVSEKYSFLCLLKLENPLRLEAKDVLNKLEELGLRNTILTGDRTENAIKIGELAGIKNAGNFYLTGNNIRNMALSEITRQCEIVSVFTRLMPSQKGIIVRCFKERGYKVAMVGDGANDVIALKAADLSISLLEGSSPLAQRSAKILINDLRDLLLIIYAGRRIKQRYGSVLVLRALLGLLLIICIYVYTF